jgi:hypothetical protein
MMKSLLPASLSLLLLISFYPGSRSEAAEQGFVLHAGAWARSDCPIILDLPKALHGITSLAVKNVSSGKTRPAQRIGERQLAFLLAEPIAAGESAEFRIIPQSETSAGIDPLSTGCTIRDGRIEHGRANQQPALVYQMAIADPPEGVDPRYRRSGFIHPIFTPQGRILTDDFPADHPHQHAIFAAWVKTEFEGRPVDFWNQLGGTGTVEHRRVLSSSSGPIFGEFQVELAHVDLSAPGGFRDVLMEEWTVRMFSTPFGNLFEIISVQRCAGESPLRLKKYHYGGMALRGSPSWHKNSDFDFLTSDGLTRELGNHSRPDWVCMHGSVDGTPCSLTVFSHPSNFRNPQPVRLHPSMPYFVFSPPVLGEFEITPDKPYCSRYRYFAADGVVNVDQLKAIWMDYSQPPRVEWKP